MPATLSTELKVMIVGFIDKDDKETLATCLRVDMTFFEAAGKILYAQLVIDHRTRANKLFLGSDIASDPSRVQTRSARTDFKRQLLQMTKSVVVHPHVCPKGREAQLALARLAKVAENIDRVIVVPVHDFYHTFALCARGKDGPECPIIKAFGHSSATVHNIQLASAQAGALRFFPSLLNDLYQATCIIPPTASFMRDRVVVERQRHLAARMADINTIRLIFGISNSHVESLERADERALRFCQLQDLIAFLTEMILFHKSTFEVVLLSRIEDPVEPSIFRARLLESLDQRKTTEVTRLGGAASDKMKEWQPKLGFVGDDKDYYIDNPSFKDELDPKWSAEFERSARLRFQKEQEE